MAKYVDDKIEYIADDVEKIKRKSGMYISYKGPKGALHLAKEVINNAIDEVISEKSPGKKIDIFVEELENRISVRDDGRGVPFDKVELICTKIQTGSKFERNDKSEIWKPEDQTAGENGVGLTAVNSLSSEMIFTIFRDGQKGVFEFIDGKLKNKKITKASTRDKDKHGTMVSFTPSEKWLGSCKFNLKELEDWVMHVSYILDSQYHMTYSVLQKGKNQIKSTAMVHKHGLIDLVDSAVKKEAIEPIPVNYAGSYLYEDNGNVRLIPLKLNKSHLGKGIMVKAAFTLDGEERDSEESNYISFCNFVNTVDHGVHVNAAKNAWCSVVSKLANDSLSDTEAKRFQVSFDDARKGLHFAISIMNSTPQFASQTKEKISNEELFKPIRFIIMNELNSYFRRNPSDLKKVINYVKTNARARLEVTKIRKSEYKPMDNLSENTMKHFLPAIGKDYQELFITEGDSALGQLKTCRDARTQAIFALRGVPKNTFGIKIAEVLTNQEFKYLIKCLGCGLGQDFDLSKLKYDKIIIFTDSDIDGFRIASLVSVFFLCHFPEIVKAGRLYKVDAPLYILEDKKHPYMLNKAEYYKLFGENLVRQIDLFDYKGNKLSNREIIDLVVMNNNYLNYLGVLVNDYSINADVIEFLTLHADTKNLAKDIKKTFNEITVETDKSGMDTVKGVYKDNYQYITIDEDFYRKIKSLYDLMYDENHGNIYYSYTNKKSGMTYNNITLGQFFVAMIPYMPKIKERLKGLGEMDSPKLWETSMDPHNRRLKRLTTDSIKQDLELFNILHGPNADARKTLMGNYILNRDDIDN